LALSYLADEQHHPADSEFCMHLRSASTHKLSVCLTKLATYSDRAFPVAAVQAWNSLPHHVVFAPSLAVFCCRFFHSLLRVIFALCMWSPQKPTSQNNLLPKLHQEKMASAKLKC